MPTHAPCLTAKELAQQFEKQGICFAEDDAAPQLWCSYCTAYLHKTGALNKGSDEHIEEREESPLSAPQRAGNQARASEPATAPPPSASSSRIVVRPTRDAVLEHCATRLHLLLYEHHTQEDLRQWCPVELHGYRMLLNHHCVYPARMFGDGRMLMDFTIAGGMLMGQDVCGGVKMWPQHRYAAAELVLPSARSGVREVSIPSPHGVAEGEESPLLKRSKGEDWHLRLIHETSEIPAEVAWAYSNEAPDEESTPWYLRKYHADSLKFIPRYFDEDHGLRSRRVMEGSLTTVLEATNTSITSEARLREQRRRHAIKFNLIKGFANSEAAAKRARARASEQSE